MTVSTSLSTHEEDTTTGFSGVCEHTCAEDCGTGNAWTNRGFRILVPAHSSPLRLLLGSLIHNRCRAHRIDIHPLPNPTFTYQLSSPSKAARRLSLHLCLSNLFVRTLMSHYGHPSSCLLTITDDETDSGHAVTDNGVQGSFCLWVPAALFTQTLRSLCCAVHLFLPLS